jgi:ABC-2 type transport system ATP-binding protein
VIAYTHLNTWSVSGPDLQKLAHELRGKPGVDQAVAFGNSLHLSGSDPRALEEAIAPYRQGGYEWKQIQSGLEDAFIHLMTASKDNYSP